MAVRDTGSCPCEPAGSLLRAHLAETDREIARLTALQTELTVMLDGLARPSACPEPVPGTWRPPRSSPERGGAERNTAEGGDRDVLMLR